MTPIRTFRSRMSGSIVLIAALTVVCIYMMWQGGGIGIAVSLLLVLLVIERTIHTEYRIDGENLVIRKGRFTKEKVIPLSQIGRVDRIRRFKMGRWMLGSCLVIVGNDGQQTFITPVDEDEFVKQLIRLKGKQ